MNMKRGCYVGGRYGSICCENGDGVIMHIYNVFIFLSFQK